MIHTTCAIETCNDGRDIISGIGGVFIHLRGIRIEIIIDIGTNNRLVSVRNLLLTGLCDIRIKLRRTLRMRDECRSRLTCQDVSISLDHTTIVIISKSTSAIRTLFRNEHRILTVAEIVALHKDISTFNSTYADL